MCNKNGTIRATGKTAGAVRRACGRGFTLQLQPKALKHYSSYSCVMFYNAVHNLRTNCTELNLHTRLYPNILKFCWSKAVGSFSSAAALKVVPAVFVG